MSKIARKLFTFDDCLRMAETGILSPAERVELIRGEILLMSPMGARHAAAVRLAMRSFVDLVKGKAMIRPRDDFYVSQHPGPADILLLVEVADSFLDFDSSVKLGLYSILGIPEYWIADLANNRLLVHSQPAGDRYADVAELHRGRTLAPHLLPDCRIAVDLLLP